MRMYSKLIMIAGLTGIVTLSSCVSPQAGSGTEIVPPALDNAPASAENTAPPPVDEVSETLPGFTHISGTITSVEEFDDGTFFMQIDYVDRYCEIIDGIAVMSGVPMTKKLYGDKYTLVLANSEFKAGMLAQAFFERPTWASEQQADSRSRAAALVCLNYGWVHIDRFDENFLSFDGFHSLTIFDDAEITFQDGTPFDGELRDLANHALAVYVKMSGSPAPDGPPIHMIASSKIIVLFDEPLTNF